MSNRPWGMSYEAWEDCPLPATAETVIAAIWQEREGWPMPISGDYTLRCTTVRLQPCVSADQYE